MDYKYIEQLIDRYFEGTTTIAEERILKTFFSQEEVPEHLAVYADVFAYEQSQANANELDDTFDERILRRLNDEGDAPVVHVKVKKMYLSDRLRPLWRAAAAVAIVVLIGGSLQRAYVTHPIEPISQFGEGIEQAEGGDVVIPDAYQESNLLHEGEKVAISIDSLGTTSKAD